MSRAIFREDGLRNYKRKHSPAHILGVLENEGGRGQERFPIHGDAQEHTWGGVRGRGGYALPRRPRPERDNTRRVSSEPPPTQPPPSTRLLLSICCAAPSAIALPLNFASITHYALSKTVTPNTNWHSMSNMNFTNMSKPQSSIRPAYVPPSSLIPPARPICFSSELVVRREPAEEDSSAEFANLSSVYRSNGRQTVGDGAFITDMTPSVIAVCHMEGTDSMYYYSTTFSGGPGVSVFASLIGLQCTDPVSALTALSAPLILFAPHLVSQSVVAVLTPLPQNALLTEGRQTG